MSCVNKINLYHHFINFTYKLSNKRLEKCRLVLYQDGKLITKLVTMKARGIEPMTFIK